MLNIVFKPYKNGLGGLNLIKQKIKQMGHKCFEIKTKNSNFVERNHYHIFDWGKQGNNKLEQYNKFTSGNLVDVVAPYTESKEQAAEWLTNGSKVLCRTILNGHSGQGIVVASTIDELVAAPLYTMYIPKQREFRIHVFHHSDESTSFKVREKRRRNGFNENAQANKYVRNHDNGWVFCDELKAPLMDEAYLIASIAVREVTGKYGAVDIGYHSKHGHIVYEVNSAPGCDNATAQWYADCFVRDASL